MSSSRNLMSWEVQYDPKGKVFFVDKIDTDENIAYNNVLVSDVTNMYMCAVKASSESKAIQLGYIKIREYIQNTYLQELENSYEHFYAKALQKAAKYHIYKVVIGNVNWEIYYDCRLCEEYNENIKINHVVMSVNHDLSNSVDLTTYVFAISEEQALKIGKERAADYLEHLIEKLNK